MLARCRHELFVCAVSRSGQSLEAAQVAKQDRVLALLDVRPGQTVLEIGCGWGGTGGTAGGGRLPCPGCDAVAARSIGMRRLRLQRAGLADRVDLRLQDYRSIDGEYDRIVSIEMLEAVGEAWWPAWFDGLRTRLRAGGVAVFQSITIDDARFDAIPPQCRFHSTLIFPGGMLPCPAVLRSQAARAGLAVHSTDMFGASYARTLRLWQERFQAAWPDIAASGFSPRFKRMWEYYLTYCEAGFRAARVDVGLWRLGHAP